MASPGSAEILETLGEGSFGVVYLARLSEGALQRTVVLKVLKADWASREEILTRARDEAVLLARLNHDNIVRVEQLTEIDGRPAVIMEHVQGLSLDHILRSHGPMPVAVAISVASKVASALDAAYSRVPPGDREPLKVVHRDIKPSNIIISVSGAVKVLDFGTAHATFDAREARTSAVTLGSPLYMAPECFDGADADPTIDMYAMGATLYEMLAGVPLGKLSVNPRKHVEKLTRRLEQLRTPELQEGSSMTRAVRNLIEKCLRYEPERRPTAADMRRLSMEFLRRMPRGGTTLDQFSTVVVEPLYNRREIKPPLPMDATMSLSGPLRLGGSSEIERDRSPAISRAPLPASAPTPPPPPPPLAWTPSQPTPVAKPPPPTVKSTPKQAPAMTPPPSEDEGNSFGTILALGVVGLVAGLLVIGFIAMAAMSSSEEGPVEPPPETTSVEEPAPPETKPPPLKAEEAEPIPEARPDEPVKAPTADPTPPAADTLKPPPADATAPSAPPAASTKIRVKVVSMPAGAEVVIDGVRQRTPGNINVLQGVSSAYITFPDGTSGSCSLNIEAGTNQLAFRQDGPTVKCP